MSKKVILGSHAREQLKEGIDILADAVVSTLGPSGRNVIIEQQNEVSFSQLKMELLLLSLLKLEDYVSPKY